MGDMLYHTHGHRKEMPYAVEREVTYGQRTQFITVYLRDTLTVT